MWGDADGWKYMDALHENIAQYTHSGSKPCTRGRRRRVPDRHLVRIPRRTTKKGGAPIDIIFPKEGLGWDLEAFGIMKSTKKLDAAQKLDGLAGDAGRDGRCSPRTSRSLAMPGVAKPLDYVPADYEQRLVKNDFAWAAEEPRQDPRRVDQALRRQVGAEVSSRTRRAVTDRRAARSARCS